MGLSSSSSSTKPIYSTQLTGASDTLTNTYNAQAPKIAGITDQITGLIPGLLAKYNAGDPATTAAQGWVTNTLGHQGGNPYLDQSIAQSGNDMAHQVNANLGTRGNLGGSVQEKILAHELGKNSLDARMQDYYQQQQLQAQAAGMAPGLAAGQRAMLDPVFSAAGAATMPINAASGYAGGIGSLLGQYTNTKTSQPWGSALLGAISNGAASAAMASDMRLKEDIRRVGATEGGIPLYSYRYKGGEQFHIGPMAQEVALLQPDALGPERHGFMTVHYGELR